MIKWIYKLFKLDKIQSDLNTLNASITDLNTKVYELIKLHSMLEKDLNLVSEKIECTKKSLDITLENITTNMYFNTANLTDCVNENTNKVISRIERIPKETAIKNILSI